MSGISADVYREDSNRIFYTSRMGRCMLVPGRERGASGDACLKLPLHMRKALRRKSREILQSRTWLERSFFCYGAQAPHERMITPTIFPLIGHLSDTGASTEGIFRREGNKSVTSQIVADIIEFDELQLSPSMHFNFARYSALELASALKYYIRETMNGLFDNIYLSKTISFILDGDQKSVNLYCKYLLLSLTDDQRRLFIMLRRLFERVVENRDATKITWESICNIFGLTFMPIEAFSAIERIPVIISLFRSLMNVNLDDMGAAVKTLQDS